MMMTASPRRWLKPWMIARPKPCRLWFCTGARSEEHTSELQSRRDLVCRLLLEKKKVTRDKEYDLTKGKTGSRIAYFSANPNGEAENVKVILKPKPRLRILQFEKDFSEIDIRGREARVNILTKSEVHRIQLKQKGGSTLGGRKVWYDPDVFMLNYEGGGIYLGEFQGDDMILVGTKGGDYRICNCDLSNQ